jgi:hypothetical protein
MTEHYSLEEDEGWQGEQHDLGPHGQTVVGPAIQLLEKIVRAPFIHPAELVSVAKALHVFKRLQMGASW